MSELKKKVLERSGFRVYVRKVISMVNELLEDDGVENIRPKLESHRINLEKQQREIEPLNQAIAQLLEADAIEKEILDRCEFETSLQETISLISSYLSTSKESKSSADETMSTFLSVSQHEAPKITSKASNKAKLPKLTLPRFAGDPTKWTTFWDSFSSAIHSSEELNEVDKFQYLKSLLEGSAAETISGLPLTSSNYSHAVDLLAKRYGSKQVIISKHIEELMKLPKVNDGGDLKQLRQLLDKTESAVRSLQGIGISTDTYGTFLTPVIMAKIPQELRLILSRSMSDEWDLDTVIKSFADELQIRERCALGPVTEQTKGKEKREFGDGVRHYQDRRPPTSSTLFSNNERAPLNKETWCTFCSGPHPSAKTEDRSKEENSPSKRKMFWLFEEWSCESRLPGTVLSLWR